MAQLLKPGLAVPNSLAPQKPTPQIASNAMTVAERMKKISDDPRFKLVPPQNIRRSTIQAGPAVWQIVRDRGAKNRK
jgi:hypothetical protein